MMQTDPSLRFSTYSIVARDPESGQFGVAVQTHQMCVGVVVPWLSAGIGALATQATSNIHFGPMGMALLRQGFPADRVVDALVATDAGAHSRQLAVVDREGRAAAWTGARCIAVADHRVGPGFSVQANMMSNPGVVLAMAEAYEDSGEVFASRLLQALSAAQAIGGDIRGMQSAALKVVEAEALDQDHRPHELPVYDLRVDEHAEPLHELERLVRLRRAQILSRQGFEYLEGNDRDAALTRWREARELAPELEELGFWQAASLADDHQAIDEAVSILKPILEREVNRADWIDLLRRMQQCGILEREGTAEALIAALAS
jgi:uncharacterized Ntn-hydrolase superfamily protein